MPRPRKHSSNAAKQKAYRERKRRQQNERYEALNQPALHEDEIRDLTRFKGGDPK